MAAAKKQKSVKKASSGMVEPKTSVAMPEWLSKDSVKPVQQEENWDGEKIDPAEEKMLDLILKCVVGFVLVWLGLSFLLVLGGLFRLWG